MADFGKPHAAGRRCSIAGTSLESTESFTDLLREKQTETFEKLNPKTREGLTTELRKHGLLIASDPRLSFLNAELVELCPEMSSPIDQSLFDKLWETSFLMEKSLQGALISVSLQCGSLNPPSLSVPYPALPVHKAVEPAHDVLKVRCAKGSLSVQAT
jgi:hypothetical protein